MVRHLPHLLEGFIMKLVTITFDYNEDADTVGSYTDILQEHYDLFDAVRDMVEESGRGSDAIQAITIEELPAIH